MEAMPLWICSIASAIIAARHGEEGNRNNYLSAHAMPDIQIETEILDTADLCPKPNKNVGRKGERRQREKKKSKREIKAAAADSCEQKIFPRTLLLIFHFLCLTTLKHLTCQVKLSHKSN